MLNTGTEQRPGNWFHEGQSWCSGEMLVGTRWALLTRKCPQVLPHVPPLQGGCVGPALHGLLHLARLEVSRRHSVSVGWRTTDQPVGIWVSSTRMRVTVHEAGVVPASAALAEVGCYEHTLVHLCWAFGLCFPALPKPGSDSTQGLPPRLWTSCHQPVQGMYI